MKCIGCGCDDEHACCEGMQDGQPIPCHWVAPGLCSMCVTNAEIAYAHATDFERLQAQSDRRIL